MTDIRLPRLLTQDGTERCRLHPSKLALHKRLAPLSTAEMMLAPHEPAVSVRDLVALYDTAGFAGIYRVSAIEEDVGGVRLVRLEHGLCTLADGIVSAVSLTTTVRQAVEHLMSCQPSSIWTLGDIDLPEDTLVSFSTGHTNLLSALLNLIGLLSADLMLTFDQSSLPWKFHLTALSDEDACEGRITRNLTDLRISTDSSDLCTRVYPYGAGEGVSRVDLVDLTGQSYLESDAAATWGIISRTFTEESISDAETLKDVAQRYLDTHSTPTVSVEAEAIDLSSITGESADSFRLGRMCRLALPEEDLILHERIIAIDEPDVFDAPGQMKLTLCSHVHDTADELAGMLREVRATQTTGGRHRIVTTSSRGAATTDVPTPHYFYIDPSWQVLSCMVLLDPDPGVVVRTLDLDGASFNVYASSERYVNLLYYLRGTDKKIVPGRHLLNIYTDGGSVNATVTLRVVDSI